MKKNLENQNCIEIIAQAFYGNRTATRIEAKDVDRFILGYLDSSLEMTEQVDRTIVRIPNSDNLVIIYNKYAEKERISDGKKWFEEDGYEIKPLAVIPEQNIQIFSRCIACRVNEAGELEGLHENDYETVMQYLAQ